MASRRPSLEKATVAAAAFSVTPAPAPGRRFNFLHEPTSRKAKRFVAPLGVSGLKDIPAIAMIFPSGENEMEPTSKLLVKDTSGLRASVASSQSAVSHTPTIRSRSSPPRTKNLPSGEKAGG